MEKIVDSYTLGNIQVTIRETGDSNRLSIDCNDGTYHSAFKIRLYEYQNYKRHLNQKIVNAYKAEYKND